MNRSEVLKKLKDYKDRKQSNYNFSKIGIFGSVATNANHEDSDIDIIIEQTIPDLFMLGTIKTELEEEFGVKIDIIRLHDGLNDFLKIEFFEILYMYDKKLTLEILKQILSATEKILYRFKPVTSVSYFTNSPEGMEKLDSICMLLAAIGEALKKLDKITNFSLLAAYPDVNWKGAKAMRDIISHQYFNIDAEIIYNVCDKNLLTLKKTISKILIDLEYKDEPR